MLVVKLLIIFASVKSCLTNLQSGFHNIQPELVERQEHAAVRVLPGPWLPGQHHSCAPPQRIWWISGKEPVRKRNHQRF